MGYVISDKEFYVATDFSILVIDHYIVRFDISVHDTHAMTVVKCSQQLIQVVSYVIISQM